MEFVPLLAAIALVWKIVDFAKLVRAGDVSGWSTQAVVWVAGVAVVFLLAATDFAVGVELGGQVLGEVNAASLVLIGLSIGSGASIAYDVKRAVDNTDSAAMPKLIS